MKKIDIELKGTVGEFRRLTNQDCPHVYINHEITDDDLNKAIDVIITAFWQRDLYKVTVDLDERNRSMMPTKEMTLEDIEQSLGHKVKIVNKKEEII